MSLRVVNRVSLPSQPPMDLSLRLYGGVPQLLLLHVREKIPGRCATRVISRTLRVGEVCDPVEGAPLGSRRERRARHWNNWKRGARRF